MEKNVEDQKKFIFEANNFVMDRWLIKINDRIRNSLTSTQPLVKLVAILGILYFLFSIFSISFHIYMSKFRPIVIDEQIQNYIGFFNFIITLLFLPSAIILLKYSSAIGKVIRGGGLAEMEIALEKQKEFWFFICIFFFVTVVFSIVGFIVAVVLPNI